MHVPTHLALSWLLGHPLSQRRDRRLVAWAGIAPDLDALSLLGGTVDFSRYHHVLTHNLLSATVAAAACGTFARSRLKVVALAFAAYHLHILCDLLGSGPDWSVAYMWPFNKHEYFSPYGWPLASWQNLAITVVALVFIAWIGIARGYTFAESFLPAKADAAVVGVLRRRFAPHRM